MKLKDAKITMLFNENGATIEVHDRTSALTFIEIELNQEQVCRILSRQGYVECKNVEVFNLDRINKKLVHKPFEFKIGAKNITYYKDEKKIAQETLVKVCPDGWTPDLSFDSQGSFFTKDGIRYARTTIRKWE